MFLILFPAGSLKMMIWLVAGHIIFFFSLFYFPQDLIRSLPLVGSRTKLARLSCQANFFDDPKCSYCFMEGNDLFSIASLPVHNWFWQCESDQGMDREMLAQLIDVLLDLFIHVVPSDFSNLVMLCLIHKKIV